MAGESWCLIFVNTLQNTHHLSLLCVTQECQTSKPRVPTVYQMLGVAHFLSVCNSSRCHILASGSAALLNADVLLQKNVFQGTI
jgi:hypothetical protein